jgi:hypothetical protein
MSIQGGAIRQIQAFPMPSVAAAIGRYPLLDSPGAAAALVSAGIHGEVASSPRLSTCPSAAKTAADRVTKNTITRSDIRKHERFSMSPLPRAEHLQKRASRYAGMNVAHYADPTPKLNVNSPANTPDR